MGSALSVNDKVLTRGREACARSPVELNEDRREIYTYMQLIVEIHTLKHIETVC